MNTQTDGILLRVFAGESDVHEGKPLYQAVVAKARELGLSGATILKGTMGFGANSVLHTAKVLEFSTDLPIVMELVDSEESIRKLLPVLDGMVHEGIDPRWRTVRIVAYRLQSRRCACRKARGATLNVPVCACLSSVGQTHF